MSNSVVALMFGVGLGGWIYAMMMRQTGSNTKASLTVALMAGLFGAFVIYTLFAWVFVRR